MTPSEKITVALGCTSLFNPRRDGIVKYTEGLLSTSIEHNINFKKVSFGRKNVCTNDTLNVPSKYSIGSFVYQISKGLFNPLRFDVNDVDLFHSPDHRAPAGLGIPTIGTIHDVFPFTHPEFMRRRFNYFGKPILANTINPLDHVITVSQYSKEQVIQYFGFKEEMVSVVYNGIEDVWFRDLKPEVIENTLQKNGIKTDFFLCIGTFQPRKNYERILEAYNQLSTSEQDNYKLVVVGGGGWRNSIDKLIESNSNILHVNNASDDDVRALYQAATSLVFPSLAEGFGYPILEAFASNCPVITSNITANKEIASDFAYLVNPYNTNEIVAGLKDAIYESAFSSHSMKNAKNYARHFSIARMQNETAAIYKKMV